MDQPLASGAARPVQAQEAGAECGMPVSLHPMFGTTAIGGAALSIIPSWIAILIRARPGELALLTVITVVTNLPAATLIWLMWHRYWGGARRQEGRFTRRPRNFRDFLNSEMEIGTGRIKGKDAYWFAVSIGLACAILGIGTGIAIGLGIA